MAAYKAINLGTTPLAAAGTANVDIDVSGTSQLTVFFSIGNATTPATANTDANGGVNLYSDDGTNLVGPTPWFIAPDFIVRAQTLTSNVSYMAQRYNVSGYTKVRLNLTNNNVAPLQGALAIVFLKSPGVS